MIITVTLNAGLSLPVSDPVNVNRNLLALLGVPGVTATVEASDIPNDSISTARLQNGSVTKAKIEDAQKLHSGLIMAYAGGTVPTGWLLCDGSSVAVASYGDLHTAIGYTFGGSGSNFTLPDLRDKFVIGKSSTKVLGSTGGTATVNLEHSHTLPAATGSHTLTGAQSGQNAHYHTTGLSVPETVTDPVNYTSAWGYETLGSAGSYAYPSAKNGVTYTRTYKTSSVAAADAAEGHTHTIGGSTGNAGSTSLSILPPYLALAYVIKT